MTRIVSMSLGLYHSNPTYTELWQFLCNTHSLFPFFLKSKNSDGFSLHYKIPTLQKYSMSDFGPKQLLEGYLPLHVLQYISYKFYSYSSALQILNIPYSFTSVYIHVPLLKPTHVLVHLAKPSTKSALLLRHFPD